MIWLLYGAGALVGVVVLLVVGMALVGLALPAAHVASKSALIARPPADIWRALTDRASQPEWRRDLRRLEALPDAGGLPSFREHSRHGVITYVVEEATAPAAGHAGLLVTRIADDTLPFGGRWIHEVADEDGGARLTITEEGVVKNPIFRFMSRFVFGHDATLEAFLRDLTAHLGGAARDH
jgi:uncharacterized protein YndB with AHSA1/START domain